MYKIWLKLFYRNSKKNWLNISINILGLTLGFAGLLFVLLYFYNENEYNAWNPNKGTIFKVIHKMEPDGEIWETSTGIEGITYKQDIPEVQDYYLSNSWYDAELVTVGSKKIYTENILTGKSNFFDFFPFPITQGSKEVFAKAKNHIAISQKLAKKYFTDAEPIGKTVKINDVDYIITMVFDNSTKAYFMPDMVTQYQKKVRDSWGNFSYTLFCKLNKDAAGNKRIVEQKMDAVVIKNSDAKYAKADGISVEEFHKKHGTSIIVENLMDIRLHTLAPSAGPEGKGNYQLILIMLSLSILLIVISCVNFINLSIASASQRAKEVGVKKTLGLPKTALIFQYMIEIVVQCLIAYILAVVLVDLVLPSFNSFLRTAISFSGNNTLVKVGLIALLVALFIGIIPALYQSNYKAIEVLKGNISRSKKGVLLRNIMLGLQFLISGFFLIGAIIVYSQVHFMMHKDLGFSGDQIAIVWMNSTENRYQKYQTLKQELVKHPNIEAVTSNYYIPGGGSSNSTNINYNENSIQANSNAIDFDYLDLLKIKVLKGRNISAKYASDTINNILINETAAKKLGIYNNPIGKKIRLGFDEDSIQKTVIGMVKDYHIKGFDRKISPMFLMHWNMYKWMKDYNFHAVQIKLKGGNIPETMDFIQNYWKKNVAQDYPFSSEFLNKQFAYTYTKYKKQKTIFGILTFVVILISLLGLFALATLTIQQRLKEVAIRKTLGASEKEIIIQLVKGFLKVTLIALVFLLPIAYYFMRNWLDTFIYKIDMPIVPFILTPLILLILVFTVVGIKAYNATKVDLIKYLKFE